ncbi:MAG: hypothetical protein WAV38_28155 [Xanthobacteraceae bacterium]
MARPVRDSRSHQAARTVLHVVGDAFNNWLRGGDLPAELIDHVAAIIADAQHDAVQIAINDIRCVKDDD